MTCFARAYAFLANVELCVGAERQRDHALTTLRLKPTTYVVDGDSDRRFMTFLVEPDSGWADERSTHEGIPHDPSDQHGSMKRGGRQPSCPESAAHIVSCPDRLRKAEPDSLVDLSSDESRRYTRVASAS
jgi:hypothetical protein